MVLMELVRDWAIVLDGIHDGIAIVDADGMVVYVNEANERITGWPKHQLIGRHFRSVEPNSHFADVLQTRQPLIGVRTKVANGEVLSNISPIVQNGQLLGVISVFRDTSELLLAVDELRHAQATIANLEEQLRMQSVPPFVVGSSPSMRLAVEQAWRVRDVTSTVLITGESGTGKELFARYIHDSGIRKQEAFVAVNCAAIPESLFESELFGYEEGAFSGGKKGGRVGLVETADGGTLFLDEVAELSGPMQAKLLRFLQFGEVRRVGSASTRKVNVRVIVATNRSLSDMVRAGTFREDLYYRLRVIEIHLPALRHRMADVPLLLHDILIQVCKRLDTPLRQPTKGFIDDLLRHRFPGNIRELENIVEQAVVLSEGPWLDLDCLNGLMPGADDPSDTSLRPQLAYHPHESIGHDPSSIPDVQNSSRLKDMERDQIERTLRMTRTVSEAAQALGISRATLYRKMKHMNVSK